MLYESATKDERAKLYESSKDVEPTTLDQTKWENDNDS